MRRASAALLMGFMLAVLSAQAVAAPPRTDPREMKARELFAAQRYQDALDLYVKLYAEKLHPNYLRNIGRCYQNLGGPEKAIGSFREYLPKAKRLPAQERAEIEGYIKEMEELKRQRDTPPPPPPPKEEPAPRLHSIAEPPPPHQTISQPPPPPVEEGAPVYRRWWFWTAVGVAVVAGTVGVMAATGTFKSSAKDPEWGAGRLCQ